MDKLYFFQKCQTSFGDFVEKKWMLCFNVGKGLPLEEKTGWRDHMTEELRAQLMGVKLTKKEKLIAEFVLDNFAEACFITSTEIAKRLNISDSSVIRFTRTLG